jgi:NADH:ubiquinone oxidoreductase subunit 3 (subunit A)
MKKVGIVLVVVVIAMVAGGSLRMVLSPHRSQKNKKQY